MGMIQHGDALDLLRTMPSNSVDAIVTDPPYATDFLGLEWDKALPDPRIWVECRRVLKPGAHAVAFGFPRLYHRLACQVEDAGLELRDVLQWNFLSGFPKNHRMSDGWGSALKPCYEPIVLARKSFTGSTKANVGKYGTGGLNIDACRVGEVRDERPLNRRASIGYGGSGAQGLVTDGGEARHPGNFVLDHASALAMAEATGREVDRWFYAPKTSRAERELGLEYRRRRNVNDGRKTSIDNPFQRGDTQRANVHPTVKPVALMRWLCRLITPPGGLVLDPFAGSGSTGIAAALEGFSFIGYDLDAEYVEIAESRIWHAMSNPAAWDADLSPADEEDERQIRIPGT